MNLVCPQIFYAIYHRSDILIAKFLLKELKCIHNVYIIICFRPAPKINSHIKHPHILVHHCHHYALIIYATYSTNERLPGKANYRHKGGKLGRTL